jgi:hypothetical protein
MDYISEPDNCDSPTSFDNQKQQEEVDSIYPAYMATLLYLLKFPHGMDSIINRNRCGNFRHTLTKGE